MEHKEELTGTCIICGSPSLPGRVCEQCNSEKCSGRRIPIPDVAMNGILRLAGAVIHLCVRQYKEAYKDALEHPHSRTHRQEYEWLDKKFRTGYYQALSMGNMDPILDTSRREVEKTVSKGNLVRFRKFGGGT